MSEGFAKNVLQASKLGRVVIASHLWIEHLLERCLRTRLKAPDALHRYGSPRFLTLVAMSEAHGILSAQHSAMLAALNALRNRYAHRMHFVPEDTEISAFQHAMAALPGPTVISLLPPSERELGLLIASAAAAIERITLDIEASVPSVEK